ncbi:MULTISPECIES: prolipoprotein diacylglyceryl transferase [Candidatus Cardinium]|uniref:prolipoprotein diacylglyceryl transferase n=1 Tax=Candidatus Cardinium TaxID=273135 RepID=UPI001FAAB530|nr:MULTISPECIES: prolipoprotein diacylglyceryl transferase [Cardinium]
MPNTIIWDVSPELFTKGFLNLRWYNLLFATGVLGGLPLWYHIFTKAGKPREEADRVKDYIVLSVLLGARLGHVIFYDWNYYKHHLLEIFLPVTFSPTFKITGFSGLASHGAGIAMVLAIVLYLKRIKISLFPPRIYFKNRSSSLTFLWIADHLSILFPLGGALIRIGNFMNSEIIGKPTGVNYGVVFVRELHDDLCKRYATKIDHLIIDKASKADILPLKSNYQPIALVIAFKETMTDEKAIKNFLEQSLKNHLVQKAHFSQAPNIYETYATPLCYSLEKKDGNYQATVYTWGIPRHPAQLYESIAYFLVFIILLLWWYRKGQTIAPGRIFGALIVAAACIRVFCECYKENQVAFENDMWLNMGQLLSLPWGIAGLFLILRRRTKAAQKT